MDAQQRRERERKNSTKNNYYFFLNLNYILKRFSHKPGEETGVQKRAIYFTRVGYFSGLIRRIFL